MCTLHDIVPLSHGVKCMQGVKVILVRLCKIEKNENNRQEVINNLSRPINKSLLITLGTLFDKVHTFIL